MQVCQDSFTECRGGRKQKGRGTKKGDFAVSGRGRRQGEEEPREALRGQEVRPQEGESSIFPVAFCDVQ